MFLNCRNMPETKRKICVWVSTDMYNNVVNAGYDSPTIAVTRGLELLIEEAEGRKDAGNFAQITAQITAENNNLKNEIERLNTELKAAPEPIELAQLRTRTEEKEKQIEEKDRYIETLKEDREKAEKDKEDLKNTYNNYFLQVQTLINQKAIEGPGNKKAWWKFW
jgi:seryl-tRNA synthetase